MNRCEELDGVVLEGMKRIQCLHALRVAEELVSILPQTDATTSLFVRAGRVWLLDGDASGTTTRAAARLAALLVAASVVRGGKDEHDDGHQLIRVLRGERGEVLDLGGGDGRRVTGERLDEVCLERASADEVGGRCRREAVVRDGNRHGACQKLPIDCIILRSTLESLRQGVARCRRAACTAAGRAAVGAAAAGDALKLLAEAIRPIRPHATHGLPADDGVDGGDVHRGGQVEAGGVHVGDRRHDARVLAHLEDVERRERRGIGGCMRARQPLEELGRARVDDAFEAVKQREEGVGRRRREALPGDELPEEGVRVGGALVLVVAHECIVVIMGDDVDVAGVEAAGVDAVVVDDHEVEDGEGGAQERVGRQSTAAAAAAIREVTEVGRHGLEDAERHLRLLVELASDGVVVCGLERDVRGVLDEGGHRLRVGLVAVDADSSLGYRPIIPHSFNAQEITHHAAARGVVLGRADGSKHHGRHLAGGEGARLG